ncbi:MAG TPA: APC family permease, partial [bacterium]|nr:APC family permease [bacterium]
NPQRVIPRAVVLSILVSIVLYLLVHIMLIGSGANLAGSEAPLADALTQLIGPYGAMIISLGAVVSMFGYCAGLALGTPRYITVLCEDGFLPKLGARQHARYGTPYVAIIIFSLATFILTLVLNFDSLVDIAATVIVIQYLLTCSAIPVLRKKVPSSKNTYTSPFGPLVPVLGILSSLLLISQIRWIELKWVAGTLFLGYAFSGIYCQIMKRLKTYSKPC